MVGGGRIEIQYARRTSHTEQGSGVQEVANFGADAVDGPHPRALPSRTSSLPYTNRIRMHARPQC